MNQEMLNTLFASVILPLITVLSGFLVAFISKKTQEIKVNSNNENVNKYLKIAEDTVVKVIATTSQTYVDALKSEGKFDEKAQKIAFEKTKSTVLNLLSNEAKVVLNTAYVDIDKWVEVLIESAIKNK